MNELLRPMLASLVDAPLTDPDLIYEPKYDGIRAIVEIDGPRVRVWSRLGNEKTAQFPEIVDALRKWARRPERIVVDGEIVALDAAGNPAGFQQLQGRIHVKDARMGPDRNPSRPLFPSAFIAFDLLRHGDTDLRDRPLTERRRALERLFGRTPSPTIRLSESVRGDGTALYRRAMTSGWEGLIAKRADSKYRSGKRTPDWRKLKIVHAQEFVIAGWTEPRQSRSYFGALLLGVYDQSRIPNPQSPIPNSQSLIPNPQSLVYVGHTGTGFNEAELARLMKVLKPLETNRCPFAVVPKTNERPHWVRPALVAQVKFTEWTADGSLRHPVYLGLRDDKKPEDVVRELPSRTTAPGSGFRVQGSGFDVQGSGFGVRGSGTANPARRTQNPTGSTQHPAPSTQNPTGSTQLSALLDQLLELERAGRDGAIVLPDGDRLSVTNLRKVFWPGPKFTKGDLLHYYVEVAPFILPVVQDRPLTMKRSPNGIATAYFYQHRAPDQVPPHVRVEHVPGERDVPTRFIGGDLKTLLHMAQLAAISQDPWFSRIQSAEMADHVALDLDPGDGVPFARVLDVARWIRDELKYLGVLGVPKTSGADGLHIYIPLPADTPYQAGLIFCQIIATVVAQKHPKVATIERKVRARGPRVYVDYLQNILGKTLACAYSARASEYGGVSTPVTWNEIDKGFRREELTIKTVPARLRQVGDLWKPLRTSKGIDLNAVAKYADL